MVLPCPVCFQVGMDADSGVVVVVVVVFKEGLGREKGVMIWLRVSTTCKTYLGLYQDQPPIP